MSKGTEFRSQSELLWPLLHVAEDDHWHSNAKAFNWVFAYYDLSDEALLATYDKTGSKVMENRGQFALNTLRITGLIERKQGQYRLTAKGRHLVNEYDWQTADYHVILHMPLLKQAREKSAKKHRAKLEQLKSENRDFQVKIDDFVAKYNQNVKDQLLAKLQNIENPTDLEPIMVQLLEAMGYRGENGSSIVTPRSNDGGVDCIINQDPLGLSKVLVQVKRYNSDHIVDRPTIQAFYGALHTTYHMDRGIFITTSDFSSSARNTAQQNNIILINGSELADLMIQYRVLIRVKKRLELYQIDD